MKKKILKLNKVKIAKIDNVFGGENPHTVGGSCGCLQSEPGQASCGTIQMGNNCQLEKYDTPCNGSQGCQSDYTCTPSNWGYNCDYTLFEC